jgi:hypothetical protein
MANTTLDGTKHFFSSRERYETEIDGAEVPRADSPREAGIIERDLSSGAERVVVPAPVVTAQGDLFHLVLSPDTRYIAFGQALQSSNPSSGAPANNALFIVPATGGTPRELFRGFRRMVWTSDDSRALLALKAPPDLQELWVVPIDGSAPRNLFLRSSPSRWSSLWDWISTCRSRRVIRPPSSSLFFRPSQVRSAGRLPPRI